jgi:hypothetical protein
VAAAQDTDFDRLVGYLCLATISTRSSSAWPVLVNTCKETVISPASGGSMPTTRSATDSSSSNRLSSGSSIGSISLCWYDRSGSCRRWHWSLRGPAMPRRRRPPRPGSAPATRPEGARELATLVVHRQAPGPPGHGQVAVRGHGRQPAAGDPRPRTAGIEEELDVGHDRHPFSSSVLRRSAHFVSLFYNQSSKTA